MCLHKSPRRFNKEIQHTSDWVSGLTSMAFPFILIHLWTNNWLSSEKDVLLCHIFTVMYSKNCSLHSTHPLLRRMRTRSRSSSAHLVEGNNWILTLGYMFLIVVKSWTPPEEIHTDAGRTCQLCREWPSPRGNWSQGLLVRRHRATIHFYDSPCTLSILVPALQWLCCFLDWQSGFKWTFKEDCQTPGLWGCSTTFGINGKHVLWRKSICLQ